MSVFNPTPAELGLVNQVFKVADPQELGIVTGDAAVKVFAGSKLPPTVLGEVWAIADKENNGFLTRKGVAIALRLIGHAQKGETVKETLIDRPGPLAHLDGLPAPTPQTSSPAPQSPPPRGSLYPPLTAEDKTKFLRLFLKCGPVNGLLNGDKARDVFIKSKLPFEKLSQIWTLADTQDRGSLDQTDFTIAMYLIQASMSGQMPTLPVTLPPGLYEQAGGGRPVTSHPTGNSVSLSPSLTGSFAVGAASGFTATLLTSQNTGGSRQAIQPQMTGQNYRQSILFSSQFNPTPAAALGASAFGNNANIAQAPWDVTPEEKARFDKFFDTLDPQKRGFIEGDVAVPFMLQSKLSGDVLAQVWDLADLNNDGHLTRDGFAIAMHLIQDKLAGKDIPATLPPSLVPPTMRATMQGASAFSAPAAAPAPPASESIKDLLWDDSPPVSATAPQHPIAPVTSPSTVQAIPVLQPHSTGQVSQQHTGVFGVRSPPVSTTVADPFGAPAFAPSAQRDLLSDEEDTSAATVPDNSAEIGNLQNQLNSTNKSLENTKAERQDMDQSLATQTSQLSALQTQLSSAKAAYETETNLLNTLRERFAKQTAEIQKAREELIRAESDLSGVRVEKTEVEGNIMRDKEDIRDLQRKLKETGDEIEQIKLAIEKAKKETKHQKGLLAIAKKQLATREAERAKAAKELEDAQREAQEATKEREVEEEELAKEPAVPLTNGAISPVPAASVFPEWTDTPTFAAAQPLPTSPAISTPLPLTSPSGKSNNPFERLTKSTGSRPGSPFSVPAADIFSMPTPQPEGVPATTAEPGDAFEQPAIDVLRASSPLTHATEATAVEAPAEEPRASSPFMHVAEPSTSTTVPSTTAPTTSDNDNPFGLNDVEDKQDSITTVATTEEKAVSSAQDETTPAKPPSPAPAEPREPFPAAEIKSAVAEGKKPEPASTPSLDKQFPPIGGAIPGGFPGFEDHTDLNSKLVEKEHEESDSDSDDEGVFHDANARLSTISTAKGAEKEVKPAADAVTNGTAAKPAESTNAFDDAFGLGDASPEPTTTKAAATGLPPSSDLFSSFTPATQETSQPTSNGSAYEKTTTPFDFPTAPAATATTGLSAFDEALGKISTTASNTDPQFKLDSAFDDNFDFTAAKAADPATAFSPGTATSTAPATNGSTEVPKTSTVPDFAQASSMSPAQTDSSTTKTTGGKPLSFDDAFGSVSSRLSSVPSAGDHGISFEEAFGGRGLSFSGLGTGAGTQSNGQANGQKQATPSAAPFPVQSPPGSPTVLTTTPASPSTNKSVRSTSPPPRTISPKPRVSTGSSSEGGPSTKSPSQRHSRLTLRLPFGRKDKKKSKHEPPPVPPPQFLSPVQEPIGATTPSVEDDVEPVKQLCSMGFSRTQAVEALEKYGYDVQRALNSLLGAS